MPILNTERLILLSPTLEIETAFRDAKQHFGFDTYQVKSRKSINRFVQLSFVAASLRQLLFRTSDATERVISVQSVC